MQAVQSGSYSPLSSHYRKPPVEDPDIHTYQKVTSRFTTAKILKIAFVGIATLMAGNVPKADAGPIAYAACVAGCASVATPGAYALCVLACKPLLAAPGP